MTVNVFGVLGPACYFQAILFRLYIFMHKNNFYLPINFVSMISTLSRVTGVPAQWVSIRTCLVHPGPVCLHQEEVPGDDFSGATHRKCM